MPADTSGALDLSQFTGAASQLSGQINQSLSDLQGTMNAYKDATAAEKPALEQKGAAEGELQLIEAAHAERVRSANADAAAMFGTNKYANSFILAGLGDEILAGQKDIATRRADIQKRKDTGFFDNPVDWLIGQVTTPFAEEALEFKEATQKQEEETARALIARTTEQFAINAAITDGDAEGKANALRKAQLGKVALEVAQSDQRLAALGLNEINVRSVLNRNQFDVALAATNMQAKLVEIGLQVRAGERGDQTLDLQKQQFDMMKQLHELEIAAKGGTAEAKIAITSKLKSSASVLGMVAPTFEEYSKMGAREKEFWNQTMSDPSISEDHMLAYNPGAAIEKISERAIPLGTPGMRLTYDKLDSIRTTAIEAYTTQAGVNGVQWKDLPKDARANKLQVVIAEALKREANNIPDQGGVFSPPPVASVLKIPAVATTEIGKVLSIQARDPNNPLRAQDVLSAAILQMQQGSPPEQMADEIATIYKSVIMDNNQQRQYKRFAIVPMSEQAGFKTQLEVPQGLLGVEGGFSYPVTRKQIVDMSNQAALTTLLTRIKIATIQDIADVQPAAPTPEAQPAAETPASGNRRKIGVPYSPSNRFDPSLNQPQQ